MPNALRRCDAGTRTREAANEEAIRTIRSELNVSNMTAPTAVTVPVSLLRHTNGTMGRERSPEARLGASLVEAGHAHSGKGMEAIAESTELAAGARATVFYELRGSIFYTAVVNVSKQ